MRKNEGEMHRTQPDSGLPVALDGGLGLPAVKKMPRPQPLNFFKNPEIDPGSQIEVRKSWKHAYCIIYWRMADIIGRTITKIARPRSTIQVSSHLFSFVGVRRRGHQISNTESIPSIQSTATILLAGASHCNQPVFQCREDEGLYNLQYGTNRRIATLQVHGQMTH